MEHLSDKHEQRLLAVAALVTAASATFALLFLWSPKDLLPALQIIPAWALAVTFLNCLMALFWMVTRRIEHPLSYLCLFAKDNWRRITCSFLILLLAGMNMVAFMWVKPVLNYAVPFWADPLLSDLDRLLFFGSDPWRLLQNVNFAAVGIIYHPIWFGGLLLTLSIAVWAPPSRERSAAILSYFLLWSFVGPAIHCLLPAGGPIFFERLGYGARYAGLGNDAETAMIADYLWSVYDNRRFGTGSGISAMPSMHVTMSAWLLLTIWKLARPLLPFAIAFFVTIFVLSMALGWHYALDGIVGTIAACLCYFGLIKHLRPKLAGQAAQADTTLVLSNLRS